MFSIEEKIFKKCGQDQKQIQDANFCKTIHDKNDKNDKYVVKETQEAGMRDSWIENLKNYVRPLSNMKPPEDDVSKPERETAYKHAKAGLTASILSVNLQGQS